MASTLPLTTELMVDGTFTSYPGYTVEGWSYQFGPDVQSGLQPGKIEFTLANPDLSMDPTNPASSLYGKIGRNTPTRMRNNGNIMYAGEAASWQPGRTEAHVADQSKGRSWISITAEGIQRRIGRWTDPIQSALRRQISSYSSLLGYWPLEDPSQSTNFAELTGGTRPGRFANTVTLASDDGPGGSDKTPVLGSDGVMSGFFTPSSGGGYQVCFSFKLAAMPSSSTYQNVFVWTDTVGRYWQWQVRNDAFNINILNPDGSLLDSSAVLLVGTRVDDWVRCRMKVTVSGGTVTYEYAWYNQDKSTSLGGTDTFSSTATGRPRSWQINANAWTDGASYGHIFATSSTSLDIVNSYDVQAAFNGYFGETTGDRFYRLMGEQGFIDRYVDGDRSASARMGRQKPGILIDLLEEIATTEGGFLYDEPTVHDGLTFRLMNFLANRDASLTLTYGTNVRAPLDKVIDDLNVANDVTGSNWDGTEIRKTLDEGALSTQAPPNGVGRYKQSLDVSLYDSTDALSNRVGWELNSSTIDRPRYTSVSVDLHQFTSLTVTATNMRPGDVIALNGVEADTVYLRVFTIQRQGDAIQDTITFKCLPNEVWQAGEYDDTSHRYDSGTTVIVNNSITTTGTSIKIGTGDPTETWSTTALPYDIKVSGERMTVTAMSATAGATQLVSGTFEGGITGWVGTGGSVSQSSTFARTGSFSGLLTVSGSPSSSLIRVDPTFCPAIVPGSTYTLTVWCRSTTTITAGCRIEWLDSSQAVISTDDSISSLASGSFVQRQVVADPPSGAVYLRYGAVITGSPANGTLLYVDDVTITLSPGRIQDATVTRSVNGIVKAHNGGEEWHIANQRRYSL